MKLTADADLIHNLDVAQAAAKAAGKFLVKQQMATRGISQDFLHDVKIKEDVEAEQIILEYLGKHSHFLVLSEERGFVDNTNQDYRWIVDPLDGTLNYIQNIPFCCVSIGLWHGEKPVLGVIYDFNRDELFYGIAGREARFNNTCLHVSKTCQREKAVLCTGFPANTDYSSESLQNFIVQIQGFKKIRLMGSAALSLAYVASGKVDAYEERDIMIWDVAAGIPLVLGAGGNVRMEKTAQDNCFNVYITNGCL